MSRPFILEATGANEASPAILEAARVVSGGGIVVHPTETLYGLAVDPWNEAALRRLTGLKGRDASRGIIVLVADRAGAADLIDARCERVWRPFAELFWPGPLTLVVDPGPWAPAGVRGAGGGIAIRWSGDDVAQALVRAVGGPITSTSANVSGQPPARSAAEAAQAFGHRVDLILDAGPRAGGVPSTLLDLTCGRAVILREGAISRSSIEAVAARVRMSRTDGGESA